jgi:tetratricopeptide (TPR) repeat protein
VLGRRAVAGSDELRGSGGASRGEPPGPLSRLLEELAQAPGDDLLAAWQEELKPGDRLDRFEIRRQIGRGGFGAVYEAFDGELGRVVAIKTLRPGRSRRDLSATWIRREAEAVAKLSHAGIVTLYDVCNCASGPYLVMELLEGRTLAERLADGPLPRAEALRVAEEMAQALAHAHKRGVLHRDLKPANVFLCDDGHVKLLDFGLAHLLGTQASAGAGTPAYMAPEQARGEVVDERADVYAAGMVLGETLIGKRPLEAAAPVVGPPAFVAPKSPAGGSSAPTKPTWPEGGHNEGVTPRTTAPFETTGTTAPPLPGVPRPLIHVISSALSPDPAGRPRDGATWLEALRSAHRALERQRSLRRLALVACAFLVLGVIIAGLATWRVWKTHVLVGDDGRISVAVADFVNHTGDADLDGLSGLLITSLEQSKRLRVLTRSRMWDYLRAMGKDAVDRIDEPLARDIGNRAGARALLLASVRKLDEVYAVEMRAVDPRRDEYLFTVKEQVHGKKRILDLVDRLSERARAELQEGSADIQTSGTRVAEAVTSSLQAFRHYFAGQQHWAAYRSDEAIREYELAIAADPNFALAHIQRAYVVAERGGDRALVVASSQRALAGADRLPPAERAFVRGFAADVEGRVDEAIRHLDAAAAMRPDKDALYLAGELHYHRDGPGDAAAAREYFARALEIDPSFFAVLDGMVSVLGILGLTDELRGWTERWSGLAPSVPVLTAVSRARAHLGDLDAAIEAARQATRLAGGEAASTTLADTLLHAGRYGEAEAFLKGQIGPSTARTQRRWAHFQLAAALAYQGRRAEALATLDAVVPTVEGGTDLPVVHQFKLEHLAGDGQAGPVWREVERIRALGWNAAFNSPDVAFVGDLANAAELATGLVPGGMRDRYYRAVVAWRSGRASDALRDLSATASERRGYASFLRGAIAESIPDDREAVAALLEFQQTFTRTRMWRSWCLPLSRVLLSRSLERSGERRRAAAEIARLLDDWAHADKGLPLLAEARAACERLGCRVATP